MHHNNTHKLAPARAQRFGTHPGPTGPMPRKGGVLLALLEPGCPTVSLHRALGLCRNLEVDLHVVRVMSEPAELPPQRTAGDISPSDREASVEDMQAWLTEALANEQVGNSLRVRTGSFVEQVAAHAAQVEAQLIVVPARNGAFGATIAALAQASCLPVFVRTLDAL